MLTIYVLNSQITLEKLEYFLKTENNNCFNVLKENIGIFILVDLCYSYKENLGLAASVEDAEKNCNKKN